MNWSRRLLYLCCLAGLGLTAAAAVARIGRPSIAGLLAQAVLVACVAGAPGLVHRRAWPAALVLLPLGAYLVARTQMPVPATVKGLMGQLTFYMERLQSGAVDYNGQRFPLQFAAAADLKLLVSLGVYATAGLAAFLALSLRRALPAIVVVLVLVGFGLTVDRSARVLWLPLGFLFFAGCLLTLSRSLARQRWRRGDGLAGALSVTLATLLALSLLGAAPVAASKPWRDWKTWGTPGDHDTRLVASWWRNYPSLLDPAKNAEVMRVTSPVASYWRANALDYFDGTTWYGGALYDHALQGVSSSGSYSYAIPAGGRGPGRAVTETFDITGLSTDFLFSGGTPRELVLGGTVPVHVNDGQALGLERPVGPSLHYTVTAVVAEPQPGDLVGLGRDYQAAVRQFTSLPFPTLADFKTPVSEAVWRHAMGDRPATREWLGLYRLNRTIVGGATDPYDITLRVEQYLRYVYSYSLRPPTSSDTSPYAAFLFQTRTGYCQHFAGAMAVLLRFNGIPARVAVGFATGRPAGHEQFIVSRTDAHAWDEVYFPRAGWVPFDPTPGHRVPGAGASSTTAGFVDPFLKQGNAVGTGTITATPIGKHQQDPGLSRHATPPVTSRERSSLPVWLPWSLAGAAVVVGWPFGRALLRRRGLRRGALDGRLRVSLALLRGDLRDHGLELPRSRTLEETSELLQAELGLDATLLRGRIQAVLFGGREATKDDLAALAALRRELKRRLRARRGWLRSLAASYGRRTARRPA